MAEINYTPFEKYGLKQTNPTLGEGLDTDRLNISAMMSRAPRVAGRAFRSTLADQVYPAHELIYRIEDYVDVDEGFVDNASLGPTGFAVGFYGSNPNELVLEPDPMNRHQLQIDYIGTSDETAIKTLKAGDILAFRDITQASNYARYDVIRSPRTRVGGFRDTGTADKLNYDSEPVGYQYYWGTDTPYNGVVVIRTVSFVDRYAYTRTAEDTSSLAGLRLGFTKVGVSVRITLETPGLPANFARIRLTSPRQVAGVGDITAAGPYTALEGVELYRVTRPGRRDSDGFTQVDAGEIPIGAKLPSTTTPDTGRAVLELQGVYDTAGVRDPRAPENGILNAATVLTGNCISQNEEFNPVSGQTMTIEDTRGNEEEWTVLSWNKTGKNEWFISMQRERPVLGSVNNAVLFDRLLPGILTSAEQPAVIPAAVGR